VTISPLQEQISWWLDVLGKIFGIAGSIAAVITLIIELA
jgi:hypothetical protein